MILAALHIMKALKVYTWVLQTVYFNTHTPQHPYQSPEAEFQESENDIIYNYSCITHHEGFESVCMWVLQTVYILHLQTTAKQKRRLSMSII